MASKLLHSELAEDWQKALRILGYVSKIIWVKPYPNAEEESEAVTVIEQYWFKKLLENTSQLFGQKCGEDAAKLLLDRVRYLFSKDDRKTHTWLWRPAIEDHPQNHSFRDAEESLISGLRDVLLAFTDKDIKRATLLIEQLLVKGLQIERRIALHVVDERFAQLKEVYFRHLNMQLFDAGLLHEHYRLLKRHAKEFPPNVQKAVVGLIGNIKGRREADEKERELSQIVVRRNWLHALMDQGIAIAEAQYAQFNADPRVGPISEHPDFLSYMESSSGPGPSPYSVADLLSIGSEELVSRLNEFQETGGWKDPTTRALVDTLEEAIKQDPLKFVAELDIFLRL